jgi:hypothetical protein
MNNTLTYYANRKVAVQFAKELLRLSAADSLSITITKLGKSEVCSVSIVTDTSSAAIVEEMATSYSKLHTSI